jgi:hypothetical protein
LTHVVQQRSGPVDGTPAAGGIQVSHPSDRFEQAAESSADRVMSSAGPSVESHSAPAPAVQRAEAAPADEETEETAQTYAIQRAEAESDDKEQDEE